MLLSLILLTLKILCHFHYWHGFFKLSLPRTLPNSPLSILLSPPWLFSLQLACFLLALNSVNPTCLCRKVRVLGMFNVSCWGYTRLPNLFKLWEADSFCRPLSIPCRLHEHTPCWARLMGSYPRCNHFSFSLLPNRKVLDSSRPWAQRAPGLISYVSKKNRTVVKTGGSSVPVSSVLNTQAEGTRRERKPAHLGGW